MHNFSVNKYKKNIYISSSPLEVGEVLRGGVEEEAVPGQCPEGQQGGVAEPRQANGFPSQATSGGGGATGLHQHLIVSTIFYSFSNQTNICVQVNSNNHISLSK